ncbi:MAG: N,N-dimethylformamidase beta subunit family domain-containing protein [Acidimicrobiales bacterium]
MPSSHARHGRLRTRRRRKQAGLLAGSLAVLAAVVIMAALVAFSGSSHSASHPSPGGSQHRKAGKLGGVHGHGKHGAKTRPATFTGHYGVEANWVIRENAKPGTTRWRLTGPQTANGIMGYASRVQARSGQQVALYVSTQAPSFHVDAFRMGYYQGKGARLIWRSSDITGAVQPACPVTPGVNMVQCAWTESLSFTVTRHWVQGQYLLKLIGSGGQQSYVPLTIWDPSSHAAYVLMTAALTDQVFNPFGGYDLYQGGTPCQPNHYPCSTRARVVSFDRPYANSFGNGAGTYLGEMYPLTRLAEKHGLDVTYWTDITLATHGNLLANHRVLISPGHDEEWSLRMRNAVVTALNQGVNLIFFGASPILRKVRLQASPLGANMQVVNYRNPAKDPLYGVNNSEVSQNWWGQPPAGLPASTIVGSRYIGYNNYASFPLVVSDPSSWLFAGTHAVAGTQVPGVLTTDFQAYDPSRANNPPNVQILAHSPVHVEFHSTRDFADTTYYTTASSKAGVFESGANSWIPSLMSCPAPSASCGAPFMRKITENLLRVFGQGPAGLRHPSVSNTAQFYG